MTKIEIGTDTRRIDKFWYGISDYEPNAGYQFKRFLLDWWYAKRCKKEGHRWCVADSFEGIGYAFYTCPKCKSKASVSGVTAGNVGLSLTSHHYKADCANRSLVGLILFVVGIAALLVGVTTGIVGLLT